MSGVPKKDKDGKRLTLVHQQTLVGVKDPSDHARRQVKELDKTATKSKSKRQATFDQIEADKKEIRQIEARLAEIHRIYDPLCANLEEKLQKRKHLVEMLEKCKGTEKDMMSNMKHMVNSNMVRNYKQNARDASFKLETLRGYNMKPEGTFKQSGKRGGF
jgi:DNA repair ATPase RecN